MSSAESAEPAPFAETKSPPVGVVGHEHRLHRGVLGITDIAAATMANIGPAMSFYFGFGLLAITAGVASPLTIVAAIVAIALLGNTLSQFSRAQPSTGGFITFVGKAFGGTSAVTTALLAGLGYIIAMSSVIAISGGFLSITLNYYLGWNVPWGIFTVILTAAAVVMMIRGVSVSTKIAGFFFAFEMIVLIVVSVAALVKNGGHLSAAPFQPSHITNGMSGLAAGFRWRSTCSSAGRTPPRWPRRPVSLRRPGDRRDRGRLRVRAQPP
jgi:amino acid transporter